MGGVSQTTDKVFKLADAGSSVRDDLLRSAQEFTSCGCKDSDPSDLEAAGRVLIRLLSS